MSMYSPMGKAGIAGGLILASLASPVSAQDILIRRPDGSYQAPRLDTRPSDRSRSDERLRLGDTPAGNTHGIYDHRGNRVGTYERMPYGGAVYDNQGRRR